MEEEVQGEVDEVAEGAEEGVEGLVDRGWATITLGLHVEGTVVEVVDLHTFLHHPLTVVEQVTVHLHKLLTAAEADGEATVVGYRQTPTVVHHHRPIRTLELAVEGTVRHLLHMGVIPHLGPGLMADHHLLIRMGRHHLNRGMGDHRQEVVDMAATEVERTGMETGIHTPGAETLRRSHVA